MYRICPQALLPVLPHLERELQAKEDAKRLAAAGLVGRLFGAAGSDMDAQCASLFSEFVRRFRDLRARPRRSAPPPACRGRLQCRKPTQHASAGLQVALLPRMRVSVRLVTE